VFLFIFESIGTSELMLIGLVALIFLGPRKMPEYARKIGKMMNEFRSTTNEFKETWEREVNFDEEAKAFNLNELDEPTVPRTDGPKEIETTEHSFDLEKQPEAPTIKSIDPASFNPEILAVKPESNTDEPPLDENDKKNWL